jgi:hypothetical protein
MARSDSGWNIQIIFKEWEFRALNPFVVNKGLDSVNNSTVGEVYPHLRRLTNKPMNTDYGFFNLFFALNPVRKAKNQPVPRSPILGTDFPRSTIRFLGQFPW